MKITPVNKAEVVVQKNGVKGQRIYDYNETIANHITLTPGARLDTHTTPVDVFFYVLEGKAWIEVGDERIAVESDSLIESPKDIPHAIENFSNTEILRVLVVKTPKT
ncbi:cupin domain-containing protein [Thiospirochaeta perfilievii]|uniref:Cupin domain-containing protein n=1 Tax=Thiospirochaeta perfilievii TaxID=252967 RepID=A0A5C1QDD2_9SPIO|nr:cupin domain-containing protein [Thiospirochaeta perfilievii]QEN05348.1 cupin domain-containing protein [Thiospirochaeta perfilievii]